MLPAANMIRTALRRPCARVDSTLPRGYSRCIRSLYERELVMFEKKIEIFKKKDRAAWTEIRDLLKKEGVAGISAGHYLQERDHGRHRRRSDDGRRPEKTPFLYLKGHFLQSHPYQVLCRVCDAVQLPYAYIFLPVDLLHVFQM